MTAQSNTDIIFKPGTAFTFDPATSSYAIDMAQVAPGIDFTLSLPTADGNRRDYKIDLSVEYNTAPTAPKAEPAMTAFEKEADLAELGFAFPTTPVNFKHFANAGGFGRLIPPRALPAHGNWSKASGDGIYRALVRVGGAPLAPTPDRRSGLGARIRHNAGNLHGMRLDLYQDNGPRIALCDYTGATHAFEPISVAPAAWTFGSWNWLELRIVGDAVSGRIYPENDPAPDWQVTGKTKSTGAGAFGPGGVPGLNEGGAFDIRRLEFVPA